MTIFVEGSANDRREIMASTHTVETDEEIERAIDAHPLVRVHGVPRAAMALTRAHRKVEAGHRHDAWRAVLAHVKPEERVAVVEAMERALTLWLAYRDEIARACGV